MQAGSYEGTHVRHVTPSQAETDDGIRGNLFIAGMTREITALVATRIVTALVASRFSLIHRKN